MLLPEQIALDAENELYKDYIARCAKLITENTAKLSQGSYIPLYFSEIIHPDKKKDAIGNNENATERIKNKLSGKEVKNE